jgi:hypothetical protein
LDSLNKPIPHERALSAAPNTTILNVLFQLTDRIVIRYSDGALDAFGGRILLIPRDELAYSGKTRFGNSIAKSWLSVVEGQPSSCG